MVVMPSAIAGLAYTPSGDNKGEPKSFIFATDATESLKCLIFSVGAGSTVSVAMALHP